MTKLRFIHISDIHFGQEQHDGSLIVHNNVRDELVRHCLTQRGILGNANGILITGDVVFSGKKKDYDKASEWLEALASAVGCSQTAVMVIPGNHDVDIDKIDHVCSIVQERLRTSSAAQLDMHLSGIASSNEGSNPLFPKLTAYREFAAQYGCDFDSTLKPVWQKDYKVADNVALRFVGLSSVQVSDKSDTLGNMVLGSNQYVIDRHDGIEYIVLVHHPMHWFLDRDKAKKYLKRARVLMFGHEHDLSIEKAIDETEGEQLTFYAGATNPPDKDSAIYQYRYNWIEFEIKSEDNAYNLSITVYPKVWDNNQTKFIDDLGRLGGASSKEILIKCPMLSTNPSKLISKAPALPQTERREETQGQIQMNNNSEQFARLRYFFWRYLNWTQRVKVLVELDILPASTSQPVPQTMERFALDKAWDSGKQHELWDAIMQFVPDVKREVNPFTKGEG